MNSGKDDGMAFDSVQEIFGPCAAAALYRRQVFDDIRNAEGVFDNRFFFLVEDFDVAWRAKRKGWKAYYVPQAVCLHYRSSSGHKSKFKQYLSFRNRYFLILKNARFKELVYFIPFFIIYDIPRILYLLCVNPYTLKGIREVFEMRKLCRKRMVV